MPQAVSGYRRALRAGTFAAVLLTSAVLAHDLSGGMLPRRPVVLAAGALLVASGWWLARRERSAAVLTVAAAVGEVGLHLTFTLTMPGPTTLASTVCGHRAAPVLMQMPGPVARGVVPAGAMALMMAAHALGGLLVLLALRSVESVAATVVSVLRAVLRWVTPPPAGCAVRRRSSPSFRPTRPSGAVLVLLGSPRRGPPASVCS